MSAHCTVYQEPVLMDSCLFWFPVILANRRCCCCISLHELRLAGMLLSI